MVKDPGSVCRLSRWGATVNDTLMQLQADVLGVPVVRPVVAETTALGAAYAAGLATGFWKDLDDLRQNWKMDKQWEPRWTADQRDQAYAGWEKAVQRTLDWVVSADGVPIRGAGSRGVQRNRSAPREFVELQRSSRASAVVLLVPKNCSPSLGGR